MNWSNISEIITFQIALYVILNKALRCRLKKTICFLPFFTIIVILFLSYINLNHKEIFHFLFLIFNILLYFVFPIIFVKDIKKKKIIYISIMIIGIFSFINAIVSFLTTFINPNPSTIDITYIFIDTIIMFLLCWLSLKQKLTTFFTSLFSLSKGVKITTILFIWELVIFLSLLIVLLTLYPNVPIISLFCFLLIVVLIISFIVFYLLITNNLKSTYYKQLNNTIQNNMNEQVRYYEKLSVANENLRKFRHDFNNLKIGLNTYLKANDTVGALNYLNDCDMLIETSNEILHTGHNIVDALFSDKLQLTKKNNIDIKFEGLIPSDILTSVDLCIIFGNTLDNAIEACFKIENNTKKVINVTVKQNHDYIFITFTNPCVENVEIKNNTILTTKENTEMHGIGLYSIKQVLKNYDGHLTLHCENNIFTTEIDFCIST